MRIIRKATALLVAAFIILRVLVIEAFAASAAPVLVAGELLEIFGSIFGEIALGPDYEEQLNGMDWNDFEYNLKEKMSDPTFNITGNQIQLLQDKANAIERLNALAIICSTVTCDWLGLIDNDDIIGTPTMGGQPVDMKGHGCLAVMKFENAYYNYERYYYGDLGVINGTANFSAVSNENPSCYVIDYLYNKDGSLFRIDNFWVDDPRQSVGTDSLAIFGDITSLNYYGDWKYADGSEFDTSDTTEPIIGEADGTAITPDMLNPDGTVTIDGVTYYPADFIDWDKLNTDSIIDLLNRILEKIDSSAVVDQDNTTAGDMVGDVAVELDIAELNNLVAPPVIADVFPFCLPFDFVKGLRLLSSKPVAPKFEIPFDIPSFGSFEGYEYTIELDMSKYSKYFEVARWVQVVLFMIGLCFISFKVVKGVH